MLVELPDPLVLSFSFTPGSPALVEITYAEQRDQAENGGVVKTISHIVDSGDVADLTMDALERLQELADAMAVSIRNRPDTIPSRRASRDDDDE